MKEFIKNNYAWIIFLVLVSAGSLAANYINHRLDMVDLEVYYKAADRMLGGEELYRGVEEDPFEHYVYKYSPPAALLFVPLLPFGFSAAKLIYWLILTILLGSTLNNLRYLFAGDKSVNKLITGSIILAIIIVGTHFFRELELGQVNLLMLAFYVFALRFMSNNKAVAAAALLSISIFIKPFALIFIPLLILYGKFKELAYFLGFSLLFLFIPMIFYTDTNIYWGLYTSWFQELGIELSNKQDLLAEGNHTIFSVLARYSPISGITLSDTGRYLYQIIVLGLIAFLFLWHIYKRKVEDGLPSIELGSTS